MSCMSSGCDITASMALFSLTYAFLAFGGLICAGRSCFSSDMCLRVWWPHDDCNDVESDDFVVQKIAPFLSSKCIARTSDRLLVQ
ncbi:hypothetical protein Ae201684_019009 [Aphanomyces euteiches]|uniref:Uncharacterized protein n=1 Tax=Aphanomyces euteiches TaxID=100861 RepID=A0A6G0W3S6_9STRA|nr:hypothetical protein Ae201684_019009 [Aphanomyces euteiches]